MQSENESNHCYEVEIPLEDMVRYSRYTDLAAQFTVDDCLCSSANDPFIPVCWQKCSAEREWRMTTEFLAQVGLPATLYLIIFLVGTIGNAMVIFVVNRFKRMRNVTNVFLASLSTADLCLIWFCVPIMFVKYMSASWSMGRFACYSLHYIQQFTCFCSVLTMTMIAFERYLAIAYPMKNMWLSSIGRAKKVILLVWLTSAVLSIPTAVRIDYETTNSSFNTRTHWCHRRFPVALFGQSPNTLNQAYALYQMLLLIVFPVVTMSVCYTRISLIVYSSSKDKALSRAMVAFSKAATDAVTFTSYSSIPVVTNCRSFKTASTTIASSLSSKKSSRVAESNKKQIVQMLISIVVMYTICWLPSIVDELLTSFGYICRTSNTPTLKHMRMGFNALTYCQSCLNPLCYAFISQNFRATFKSAYARMKLRLQGADELRSRIGSYSSASILSTRNHHRVCSSMNTLTVPGRSIIITPNLSRDVSQLSLARPRSPIAFDAVSQMRARSPTETSRDSGRPRSPTDVSQMSRARSSLMRRRSPTSTSRASTATETNPHIRTRSPTNASQYSGNSVRSLPNEHRQALLTVSDAIRSKTPDFV